MEIFKKTHERIPHTSDGFPLNVSRTKLIENLDKNIIFIYNGLELITIDYDNMIICSYYIIGNRCVSYIKHSIKTNNITKSLEIANFGRIHNKKFNRYIDELTLLHDKCFSSV